MDLIKLILNINILFCYIVFLNFITNKCTLEVVSQLMNAFEWLRFIINYEDYILLYLIMFIIFIFI